MPELQRLAIAPTQQQGEQILLTAEQQHYLLRVLRLREGDRFIAIDGQGNWLLSQLTGTSAQILEVMTVQTELPGTVTLIAALPKNGFDEVVRQTTELGVSCIMPVTSDRSLLHPSSQKLERWRRIAAEAAEQSERQLIPEIFDPIPFSESLLLVNSQILCIGAERRDAPHLLTYLENTKLPDRNSVAIAIGSEGGWTSAEIAQAISAGWQPVTLGKRILRAVTAPQAALALIAAVWESPLSDGELG